MFAFINRVVEWFKSLFWKEEMELTLVGLQNSGKTTFVNVIASGQFNEDMIPTVGFNMRKVTKGNVTIKLWDIGGQPRFRSMWERYCRGVTAIVYMVDAADHEKLDGAKNELHSLLDKPQLSGIPVLVLGNKVDLPNSLRERELIERMSLNDIKDRENDNEVEEEHEKSDLEEAEAGDDLELEGEGGSEVIESNLLTKEVAGESLSLLCRTGNGLAHAYVRMDLKDKGLTDISILEGFKHVRYVDISGNALEDISSLAALPHLLTIKVDHNRLTSAYLPELQYLQIASFAHNRITSTKAIAHPMLESLDLSYNRITELAGLDANNLPCLRVLDLHANRLTSLAGIHIPTLHKLYAASNKLTQCDGIQSLHQLTTLHVRENQIASLDGFVPSLGALQYLNLRANLVENPSQLTKLKCLPLLRAVVLAENPLCELEDYRVEVCMALRKLERLDKDEIAEDERADAEEMQQQRQNETEETSNEK